MDVGDGLTDRDCHGIDAFRQRGGGILAARDHQDLGSSLCKLTGVCHAIGASHYFHQGFSEKPRASTDRGGIGATIEGFDAPKSPYRRTILRFSLYNVRHGKGFQLPLLPIC